MGTKPKYTMRPAGTRRAHGLTTQADSEDGALDGAWALLRHTGQTIEIVDTDPANDGRGGGEQVIATLTLEWHEREGGQ